MNIEQKATAEQKAIAEQKATALTKTLDKVLMSAPPNLRYSAIQEKIESGERILSKLMLKMDKRIAINVAWEYFNQSPYMWKGHSSKLNIKTTVRTYDEEDGQYPVGTILHYIQDGKTVYCKSTDINELGIEVGEQPIFYYGSFEIDNHNFELCFDRLKEGVIEFKPKQEASYYNTKNLMHI
jgi:hypothetical protein